jgi:tripartite-type tricarboxylate transporter receptor subunit TctC
MVFAYIEREPLLACRLDHHDRLTCANNVGHAGLGSVSYIGCLLLNSAIGIKPTMVPFTGTAPMLNAMLGGQSTMNAIPCSAH